MSTGRGTGRRRGHYGSAGSSVWPLPQGLPVARREALNASFYLEPEPFLSTAKWENASASLGVKDEGSG